MYNLYVDDLRIKLSNETEVIKFKTIMKNEFGILDLRDLTYF